MKIDFFFFGQIKNSDNLSEFKGIIFLALLTNRKNK